jgi:type VI secretion system protein ImpM
MPGVDLVSTTKPAGFFGKLPAHGDFIYRDLPSSFISAWDSWLQGFVGSSREQIGEGWLDMYLTSPIWRFAFSEGVIDQHAWAGIVLPSVDRVGRYFPFSIAKPVAGKVSPLELITQTDWFEGVESAALQALDGRLVVDQLVEEINLPQLRSNPLYLGAAPPLGPKGAVVEIDFEGSSLGSAFPYLLDAAIKESSPSYSVWATEGSEHVEPCFFYCRGLPRMQGVAALLDGRWDHWGWSPPCRLNLSRQPREMLGHGNSE